MQIKAEKENASARRRGHVPLITDLTFCKEYDLIRRFPYGVRTKFTDFEFSTENNVIGLFLATVETVITHTPRWMAQAMGYYRLWVWRGMLKIGSKNHQKIGKID